MRRLTAILASVLAASLSSGCGGMKNTNPLLALGGETDNSLYHFETTVTPWILQPGAADSLFITNQLSFKGLSSMAVHVTGMTSANASDVGFAYGSPTDFSGKKITAWVFLPVEGAPSDDMPSFGQIYLKDSGFHYANCVGVNLNRGGWTKFSWSPLPNTSGSVIDDATGYYAAGFNPALSLNFGVKVGVAGIATGFSYTGDIFIDSVDIQ